MKLMPQEVEVWYLIPALRREVAKILISKYNLSQKKVAETIGVTESAISQYLNSKRGEELKFDKHELSKISHYVDKIVNDRGNMNKYMFNLSQELRGCDSLCELHRKHDSCVSKNCDLCMTQSA